MTRLVRFSAFGLAFSYVALTITVLALFAVPLWYAWTKNIEDVRTELIREEAANLRETLARRGPGVLSDVIEARVGGRPTNILLLFTDPARKPIAGNLPAWPREVPEADGLYTLDIHHGDHRVRASIMHERLPGGFHLLVGRDTARFHTIETLYAYGLAGAAAIVLLLGVWGGLALRRALLSEVRRINQTASAIVQGDLSRRLPVGGTNELDVLAQTVNRMLDQIEQLIHGVRNVSNAIAHDLRTPLAELRACLEVLVLTKPPAPETFAGIECAIADVDRVIGIFNALLRLAEVDTGTRRSGFVEFDLKKVVFDAVEFYQPLAELQGVSLTFDASGEIRTSGDPLLFAQAIGNLIDNAIKYAGENGRIEARLARSTDGVIRISIADDGPGIPDDDKPKVTERFYRGDASRATPGVGLGLSMVAAVAKLHGGSLELADNHPGLRATLVLGQAAAA
jgi:signal transduction histidine kinase